MKLECLVFDCDGVILDSVPVKTRAFGRLAEPFGPELAPASSCTTRCMAV